MQNLERIGKRSDLLSRVEEAPYDLVIIGGGISGLGCLRDASRRGLRTLLLEKEDFCSGTSSRSSKLIHGGLRYLETWDWFLVFESLRERARLLKNASGQVKPLRFLLPVYEGDKRPLWMVQVGVWIYHLLALFRDLGRPRRHSKRSLLRRLPFLESKGLKGGVSYPDALMNDVDLGLANLRSAWKEGGEALNHAEVLRIQDQEKGFEVHFTDRLSGDLCRVKTSWVLNTTGPWAGFLDPSLKSKIPLRPTKGVHILLPRKRLPIEEALLLTSPDDERVSFAIPWEGVTLIGTTDTDLEGHPNDVRASKEDVEYLLRVLQKYFPSQNLEAKDILSTFAGLRPLIHAEDVEDPSAVSREHAIPYERPGFLSLLGGKYTTFRQMAEDALNKLLSKDDLLSSKAKPCSTARSKLEGRDHSLHRLGIEEAKEKISRMIEEEMAETPWDILGNRSFLALLDPPRARELLPYVIEKLGGNLPTWMLEEFEAEMKKAQSGLS